MTCCFAIIPDGANSPVAVFESLEDAMEWAVGKYGGNKFSIRHVSALDVTPAPGPASSGDPAN